jgi:hypothetical protein
MSGHLCSRLQSSLFISASAHWLEYVDWADAGWIQAGGIAATAGIEMSSHLMPEISAQLLCATAPTGISRRSRKDARPAASAVPPPILTQDKPMDDTSRRHSR